MQTSPQYFVRRLFSDLRNAKSVAGTLKASADLIEIQRLVRAIPKYPHPLTQHFYGIPWHKQISGLFGRRTQVFTDSLLAELQWTAIAIHEFSKELNQFLTFRNSSEYEFLRGEFEEAARSAQEAEKLFGVSLWSLQQRF